MRVKGKSWFLLGLALLLALLLAAPAVAGVGSTTASNVEKVTLVHYPAGKAFAKPPVNATPTANNEYYKLLKVSWDVPEGGVQFYLATSNWLSLAAVPSVEAVQTEMEAAFEVWDAATSVTELFPNTVQLDSGAAVGALKDGKNTISFGPVSYAGALAVTTYWYNRATGRFLEADIEFSTDSDYKWGMDLVAGEGAESTLDSSTYDVRNVGTHEVGHVVGLADLYRSSYSQLTMFGYASPAETLKRTLEAGDIAGTQRLYGK